MQEAGDNGSGRLDSWVFGKSSQIDDGCILSWYLHKCLKMIIVLMPGVWCRSPPASPLSPSPPARPVLRKGDAVDLGDSSEGEMAHPGTSTQGCSDSLFIYLPISVSIYLPISVSIYLLHITIMLLLRHVTAVLGSAAAVCTQAHNMKHTTTQQHNTAQHET